MIVLRLNENDLLTLIILVQHQIKLYGRNGKSFHNDLKIYSKNTKKYKTSKSLLEYQIKDIKHLVKIYKELKHTLNFLKEYC